MNIETITMDPGAARQAWRDYQAAVRAERRGIRSAWRAEDLALVKGYRELAQGRQLLDVGAAMRMAGVREDGYPKLAIARSHIERVSCHLRWGGGAVFHPAEMRFWGRGVKGSHQADIVEFPEGTFTAQTKVRASTVSTLVPIIPPVLRPKTNLANFHTLWEVESWTLEPPKDPLLLRHLGGELYAVLAVWDLTELERAVLRGRA